MKKTFGILLVLAGTFALLDNLHILDFRPLLDYLWPSFLIVLGLSGLIGKNRNVLFSLILIMVGGVFLAQAFDLLNNIQVSDFIFPTILIFIGISFLFPRRSTTFFEYNSTSSEDREDKYTTSGKKKNKSFYRESNRREYNAILSGLSEKIVNKDFKNVTLTTLLGSANIDFREIDLTADSAVIEVNSILGSSDLYLPIGFRYEIEGTTIFGEVENFLENDVNASKIIQIHYACVLGEITLRH